MHRRTSLLAAVGLLLGATTAHAQPITEAQISQIIAAPDRTPADRTNDLRRKPERILAFIAIHPGITAMDLSAAGGYTTELLARAIGPTGHVYGQSQPRDPSRPIPAPAAPEGNSNPNLPPAPAAAAAPAGPPRTSPIMLADREARMHAAGVQAAPIVAVPRPFADPMPPELADAKLDLVTLMFNYHDLGHMGVDRNAMNQATFRALKHGGLYVIGDHSGRPRHRHLRSRHPAPHRGSLHAPGSRSRRLQTRRSRQLPAQSQ